MSREDRSEKFRSEHPKCCLCGGVCNTEQVEHAPPKIMFVDKARPKGFEVPSCARCNNGSAQQDQIASMFALSQSPKLLACDAHISREARGNPPIFNGVYS